MSPLNRRDFLRAGIAGSVLFSTGLHAATSAATSAPAAARSGGRRRARNVIVLVADGMSMGTLAMTERYLRCFEGRGTRWIGLYQEHPGARRAAMDTCSADSLVTDSAAASSAWGSGLKVNNGAINQTPDGRLHTPILRLAAGAGIGTALVTSARITHATPAGFGAMVESRVDEPEIALQYLDARYDVLLGGGARFFEPGKRKDKRDLFAEYSKAGYHVARDRGALLAVPSGGRLLGVFDPDHLPYVLDRRADGALDAAVPSLAEMARAAIARMAGHPGGFLMQIEGAKVDMAAHANDIAALIHEQIDFDAAVGVALDFAAGRDDTLVVITTDHGNANPGLNGSGGSFDSRGGSYGDTQKCFERVAGFRQTNDWVIDGLSDESTPARIRDRIKTATGIEMLDDEISLLQRALKKDPSPREGYRVRNRPLITLGQLVSNYTSTGWTGIAHTTDYVELAAIGPGSEPVRGLMQNTDLFGVMTGALGLAQAGPPAAVA
ncbi:alkaline phosphatase [Termitidicoccus mucosus]|uniref:Alkaline phosphatase n=1 Tax=Termitidicoccus mucosus TaxID=1184151 RepID=A0A178IBE8_9BACT|nr:hypothetical protein AW736_24655 [Opitutaceae bacterium TSB47]